MASKENFVIKCKTNKGSYTLLSLSDESTVSELRHALQEASGIDANSVRILCGYPPKALSIDQDSCTLKDVNICSGDTVIVDAKREVSGDLKGTVSTAKVKAHTTVKAHNVPKEDISAKPCSSKVEKADPKVDTSTVNEQSSSSAVDPTEVPTSSKQGEVSDPPDLKSSGIEAMLAELIPAQTGIMMRHVVPSNNSCLFTSVYFVLSNGQLCPEKSNSLRAIIAEVVASNPYKYNEAILSMPNPEYCQWIQDPQHWGGAIELAILSEHFKVEIVAIDTISLTMHRFGENHNFPHRIFLIYDGIHYDPLVMELDTDQQTIFSTADDTPMEMALELAREAQSSRQFTDMANFTLRCTVCSARLQGDKEARIHAMETGHTEFGEITA